MMLAFPRSGQFLDAVRAIETCPAEIGVEKSFLAAKALEVEGEEPALLLIDEKRRDVFVVIHKIGACCLEMFEIAAAFVPPALADGKDIVGECTQGAGGHQAVDAERCIGSAAGKMSKNEDREAKRSL